MQRRRKKVRRAQAIVEYFLILLVIAILTIVGFAILPGIDNAGRNFANEAIKIIENKK